MSNPFLPLVESEYTRPVKPGGTYREAIVTKIDPRVEVRFFTDSTSTPLTKPPLVAGLQVGDMVLCVTLGQSLTVLGKYGGTLPPAPPDNTVIIGGNAYQASGTMGVPSFSFTSYPPMHVASVTVSTPYIPPSGYGFHVYCLKTTGFTSVSVAAQTATNITLRIMQVQGSNTALSTLGWRLTKI